MEDAVNESLIVGDEEDMRKQRGIKKRELTMKVKKLKSLLPGSVDNNFQMSEIRHGVVADLFCTIKDLKRSLVNLHDRVQLLREADLNAEKEERLLEVEDAYLEEVEESYYTALEIHEKYTKQLDVNKSLPGKVEVQKRVGVEEKKAVVEEDVGDNPANVEELEDMLSRAITEYRVVKASADDMVDQVEDFAFDKMVQCVMIRGIPASRKLEQLRGSMTRVLRLIVSYQSSVREAGRTTEFDHQVERTDSLKTEDKLEDCTCSAVTGSSF